MSKFFGIFLIAFMCYACQVLLLWNLCVLGFVRVRDADGLVSDLVIRDEFSDALVGVDGFSHLYVLYWMHGVKRAGLF